MSHLHLAPARIGRAIEAITGAAAPIVFILGAAHVAAKFGGLY